MCRWMAYSGSPIALEEMLYKPKHSLIDQSMSSKSLETPTNGDGFGIGWYGRRKEPAVYHSIRPAWNDYNLRDLAAEIETPIFLAHVRAATLATVQETNCHPFRYGPWLFMHNGEIFEIEKFRRELLFAVDSKYFTNILGTTDSEIMFHLALTFGLETDAPRALARMAGFVEKTGREHGVEQSLWMTVAASDGQALYAARYASDGDAPTLYHSRDIDDVYELNPQLRQIIGRETRVIVSEPVGAYRDIWKSVPRNTLIRVERGAVDLSAFSPE